MHEEKKQPSNTRTEFENEWNVLNDLVYLSYYSSQLLTINSPRQCFRYGEPKILLTISENIFCTHLVTHRTHVNAIDGHNTKSQLHVQICRMFLCAPVYELTVVKCQTTVKDHRFNLCYGQAGNGSSVENLNSHFSILNLLMIMI